MGVSTAYAAITITLAADVKITGDTELDGKLIDTNNEAGTSGQVLSSTETGIDWIDASSGPVGATGMTGMTGVGLLGPVGATGMTGVGLTGATGMTGVGLTGATGMTGMTGLGSSEFTLVTQYFSSELGISAGATDSFIFDCPFLTEWVVSGGIIETTFITPGFILKDSVPFDADTWLITAENSSIFAATYFIWIICLDFISVSASSSTDVTTSEEREAIVIEPIPFTNPNNIREN